MAASPPRSLRQLPNPFCTGVSCNYHRQTCEHAPQQRPLNPLAELDRMAKQRQEGQKGRRGLKITPLSGGCKCLLQLDVVLRERRVVSLLVMSWSDVDRRCREILCLVLEDILVVLRYTCQAGTSLRPGKTAPVKRGTLWHGGGRGSTGGGGRGSGSGSDGGGKALFPGHLPPQALSSQFLRCGPGNARAVCSRPHHLHMVRAVVLTWLKLPYTIHKHILPTT